MKSNRVIAMKTFHWIFLTGWVACGMSAHGQVRSSANYSVSTESKDAGGGRATSASYTNDGSAGGIIGVSTVASPSETAKQGYIAQLYEITGLTLSAASLNVSEGTTDQLGASFALDDGTSTAVAATSVAWSVLTGPVSGISAAGLATAGNVYQNTAANVQGVASGVTGTLGLTIVNVTFDDYATYAGDGLNDEWQVQYFGQPPNANAGPVVDPDGDGQNNRFEFFSGYSPIDPSARFDFRMLSKTGNTATVKLSKVIAGTTYRVQKNNGLGAAGWSTFQTLVPSSQSLDVTVPDTAATDLRTFYRVTLSR